jgi:hypothetical protein
MLPTLEPDVWGVFCIIPAKSTGYVYYVLQTSGLRVGVTPKTCKRPQSTFEGPPLAGKVQAMIGIPLESYRTSTSLSVSIQKRSGKFKRTAALALVLNESNAALNSRTKCSTPIYSVPSRISGGTLSGRRLTGTTTA